MHLFEYNLEPSVNKALSACVDIYKHKLKGDQ